MNDCIFCKIVSNQVPSYKIFENDYIFAFLDISPINKGHTLIVPKKHFENILDIESEYLEQVITTAKNLSIQYKKRLGAVGFNILHASGKQAHQSVFHFHMHLIPRYEDDKINLNLQGTRETNENLESLVKLLA